MKTYKAYLKINDNDDISTNISNTNQQPQYTTNCK